MLAQFNWCTSVALCLNAQLVVSTTDPMLRSPVGHVPLAESKQKRQIPVLARTTELWRNCRKIAVALIDPVTPLPQLWLCIDRIAEIKILPPRGNPAADQVHDYCIVRDSPRSISSASHIPVPLDGRLSSVSRNEDIFYRDSQIAELLEITGHRRLHILRGHMPPRRNQFRAWKPVRRGNSKIMLLPRLYLPVHEFPHLHRVIFFGRIVSSTLWLVRVTD